MQREVLKRYLGVSPARCRRALVIASVLAGVAIPSPSFSGGQAPPIKPHQAAVDPSVSAAFEWLDQQMDQYHQSTIVVGARQYQSFYPKFMGDALTVPAGPDPSCTSAGPTVPPMPPNGPLSIDYVSDPTSRPTGYDFKISYHPDKNQQGRWAGVFFVHPDNTDHTGCLPGRNLTGAHAMTLWARADANIPVKLSIGQPAELQGNSKYWTPFLLSTQPNEIDLTRTWQRISIKLASDIDLRTVLVGLAVAFADNDYPNPTTIYIRNASYDLPHLNQPRFIQSYSEGASVRPPVDLGVPTLYPPDRSYPCQAMATPEGEKSIPDQGLSAPQITNAAFLYDQALALLAYLARGTPDDLHRASLLAQAMVVAQTNDAIFNAARADKSCGHQYDLGRMRNAYAAGDLTDPDCGSVILPGSWSDKLNRYVEDEYAAGTDTGNMAWAGIALVQADITLWQGGPHSYLSAARRIGRWIVANMRADNEIWRDDVAQSSVGPVGFFGGFEGFPPDRTQMDHRGCSEDQLPRQILPQFRSGWRSTEHNIDLYVLFTHLAETAHFDAAEPAKYWNEQTSYAQAFVREMQESDTGRLRSGDPVPHDPYAPAREVIPVDIQSWAVLANLDKNNFRGAAMWALSSCGDKSLTGGFRFDCGDIQHNGSWWEGSAQLADALKWLGMGPAANSILSHIARSQHPAGRNAGAIDAASADGVRTGMPKFWRSSGTTRKLDLTYNRDPHVGATAWYIFARLGANPYFVNSHLK